jgi:hypothetical protein
MSTVTSSSLPARPLPPAARTTMATSTATATASDVASVVASLLASHRVQAQAATVAVNLGLRGVVGNPRLESAAAGVPVSDTDTSAETGPDPAAARVSTSARATPGLAGARSPLPARLTSQQAADLAALARALLAGDAAAAPVAPDAAESSAYDGIGNTSAVHTSGADLELELSSRSGAAAPPAAAAPAGAPRSRLWSALRDPTGVGNSAGDDGDNGGGDALGVQNGAAERLQDLPRADPSYAAAHPLPPQQHQYESRWRSPAPAPAPEQQSAPVYWQAAPASAPVLVATYSPSTSPFRSRAGAVDATSSGAHHSPWASAQGQYAATPPSAGRARRPYAEQRAPPSNLRSGAHDAPAQFSPARSSNGGDVDGGVNGSIIAVPLSRTDVDGGPYGDALYVDTARGTATSPSRGLSFPIPLASDGVARVRLPLPLPPQLLTPPGSRAATHQQQQYQQSPARVQVQVSALPLPPSPYKQQDYSQQHRPHTQSPPRPHWPVTIERPYQTLHAAAGVGVGPTTPRAPHITAASGARHADSTVPMQAPIASLPATPATAPRARPPLPQEEQQQPPAAHAQPEALDLGLGSGPYPRSPLARTIKALLGSPAAAASPLARALHRRFAVPAAALPLPPPSLPLPETPAPAPASVSTTGVGAGGVGTGRDALSLGFARPAPQQQEHQQQYHTFGHVSQPPLHEHLHSSSAVAHVMAASALAASTLAASALGGGPAMVGSSLAAAVAARWGFAMPPEAPRPVPAGPDHAAEAAFADAGAAVFPSVLETTTSHVSAAPQALPPAPAQPGVQPAAVTSPEPARRGSVSMSLGGAGPGVGVGGAGTARLSRQPSTSSGAAVPPVYPAPAAGSERPAHAFVPSSSHYAPYAYAPGYTAGPPPTHGGWFAQPQQLYPSAHPRPYTPAPVPVAVQGAFGYAHAPPPPAAQLSVAGVASLQHPIAALQPAPSQAGAGARATLSLGGGIGVGGTSLSFARRS